MPVGEVERASCQGRNTGNNLLLRRSETAKHLAAETELQKTGKAMESCTLRFFHTIHSYLSEYLIIFNHSSSCFIINMREHEI
jgi:hypothetical protein